MDEHLPPSYELSNQLNVIIANKFYIKHDLLTNCKTIINFKTDQVIYKFALGKFFKEFFIYTEGNVRLISFKETKSSRKEINLLGIFDNEKHRMNYKVATIQSKQGEDMILVIKYFNQTEHEYKLKEKKLKENKYELNLYYSNSMNKKQLVGNGTIDLEDNSKELGYFNFNIQMDKHLETILLGFIMINLVLKEKKKDDIKKHFQEPAFSTSKRILF